jgi:hypothetical protein
MQRILPMGYSTVVPVIFAVLIRTSLELGESELNGYCASITIE